MRSFDREYGKADIRPTGTTTEAQTTITKCQHIHDSKTGPVRNECLLPGTQRNYIHTKDCYPTWDRHSLLTNFRVFRFAFPLEDFGLGQSSSSSTGSTSADSATFFFLAGLLFLVFFEDARESVASTDAPKDKARAYKQCTVSTLVK